jgi:hypothetical protein
MFDPINFSDSSAEFRFDPNSTISLSTLEFSPAEPVPPPPSPSVQAAPAAPMSSPVAPVEDVTLPNVVLPPAEPAPMTERTQAVPVFGSAIAEPETELELVPRETAPATDGDAATDAAPDLPPSRTLAELYERQGFPDEARRIYERLAAEHPDDENLTQRIVSVRDEPSGPGDARARRIRALEAWLARVHANAASGTRPS